MWHLFQLIAESTIELRMFAFNLLFLSPFYVGYSMFSPVGIRNLDWLA